MMMKMSNVEELKRWWLQPQQQQQQQQPEQKINVE